ncbi:MAG: SDR family NAD(P)-dependent oxidoreductase [Gammaproteobacteria bacterium]|nr:SDR family NAD(P)-dependent oxidoreductase [Gammaproteobacteria bacterium]
MQKRSVLITGCSSGIGLHIAQTLQQRGYQVFASARKQQDIERLTQQGLRCLQLDVSSSKDIQQAVKTVLRESRGNLFALINNAGYEQPGAVEDLTREALQQQFATNLFGLVELTNTVLLTMHKQEHGRIIQISSVLGMVAMPLRGAYIASKFALEGITDTLRLELKNTNIHVSLIEPGPITSRFRQNSLLRHKEFIDSKNSRFQAQYQATEKKLNKLGPTVPFTLGPEAVLKSIIHALENPQPKARYFVTFPTYLFAVLRRILPTKALDYVLAKSSTVEHK